MANVHDTSRVNLLLHVRTVVFVPQTHTDLNLFPHSHAEGWLKSLDQGDDFLDRICSLPIVKTYPSNTHP